MTIIDIVEEVKDLGLRDLILLNYFSDIGRIGSIFRRLLKNNYCKYN